MTRTCHSGPPSGDRGGAFTLIEIIIAMTIIAVIAAVAVPTLQGLNAEEKVRAPLTSLADMVQEVRSRALREHRPYTIYFERDGIHALQGNRDFAKRDEFLKYLEELRTPPEITEFEQQEPERTEPERNDPAQSAGSKPLGDKPSQSSTSSGNPSPSSPGSGENANRKESGESPAGGKRKAREMPWTESVVLNGDSSSGNGNGGGSGSISTSGSGSASGKAMQAAVLLWGDGEWDDLDSDRLRRWVFQNNGMASPAQVRLTTSGMELEAAFDLLTGELVRERIRPAQAGRP